MDEKDRLIIDPWCFDGQSFDLSVETRYLEQATVSSEAALQNALEKAVVTLKGFKFKSGSNP